MSDIVTAVRHWSWEAAGVFFFFARERARLTAVGVVQLKIIII